MGGTEGEKGGMGRGILKRWGGAGRDDIRGEGIVSVGLRMVVVVGEGGDGRVGLTEMEGTGVA